MADLIDKAYRHGPGYKTIGEEFVSSHVKRVSISSAQFLTLFSAPVPVVPAPGAGMALIYKQALFQFQFKTTPYTFGFNSRIAFCYHGHTTTLSIAGIPTAVSGGSASANVLVDVDASTLNGVTVFANTGLDLLATVSDFAAGDSTMIVTVSYNIISLG